MRLPSPTPDPTIVWPAGCEPAAAVVYAQNTITIAAPAARVWALLVDCVAWPRWYRECSDVSIPGGRSSLDGVGARFRFKTLGLYFEPVVTTFVPERMLVWSAKGPAGTSGAHAWSLTASDGGCRVVTEEAQKGAMLHLVRGRTTTRLHAAHEEWLSSLRTLAERGASDDVATPAS